MILATLVLAIVVGKINTFQSAYPQLPVEKWILVALLDHLSSNVTLPTIAASKIVPV